MIPTGEQQWKKLQEKGWRNCHLLTLHYLAVSANSARKLSVRSKSKFWSVLHFHEGKFEKHGSLILLKTFWLFWVSFVKEITTVFFFTQTKVIVPWKQIRVWQRIIHVIYGLFTYVCFPSSQHYASRSGHEEVCQLLLEQGADVNAQTKSGKVSSLHRAAYSGHMSVVNLLIKYGADLRLCDSDGQIPLHKVTMKLLWFDLI